LIVFKAIKSFPCRLDIVGTGIAVAAIYLSIELAFLRDGLKISGLLGPPLGTGHPAQRCPSLSTAPALLGAVAFGRSVLPPEHTTRLFRGGSEPSSEQAVQVSYSGWGFRILDRRTEMRAASKAPQR
jgi:hypothetical protein